MATPVPVQTNQDAIQTAQPRWRSATRVAFRFCLLYFGLYCLTNQVITGLFPIPKIDLPDPGTLPPIRAAVFWTAAHLFYMKVPLVYTGSGSGDKQYDWVLVFSVLIVALAGTAAWSILDRKRANYIALHKWFHVFLRYAVGATMVLYGMDKAVPLQMPFPHLSRLVEPYGNFSPMGVLWYSIGSSPSYEIFVGSAELLGGILLFIPRTALLGALICLADATEVFTLNMTYDVPVKLLSFHLILMTLVLLAPEMRRLAAFFFSDRAVGPPPRHSLFRTPRANRIALWAQIVFGLLIVAGYVEGAWSSWYRYGGGAPKSALYGIWNVAELSVNGAVRPAMVTDRDRWRRVIFDRPTLMAFQRMDDTFQNYVVNVDTRANRIAITKGTDKNWATLNFVRPVNDQLTLDGNIDGREIHMGLQLVNRNSFLLVSRGFHWVQDYPFNR
jgi:hypothetical protein